MSQSQSQSQHAMGHDDSKPTTSGTSGDNCGKSSRPRPLPSPSDQHQPAASGRAAAVEAAARATATKAKAHAQAASALWSRRSTLFAQAAAKRSSLIQKPPSDTRNNSVSSDTTTSTAGSTTAVAGLTAVAETAPSDDSSISPIATSFSPSNKSLVSDRSHPPSSISSVSPAASPKPSPAPTHTSSFASSPRTPTSHRSDSNSSRASNTSCTSIASSASSATAKPQVRHARSPSVSRLVHRSISRISSVRRSSSTSSPSPRRFSSVLHHMVMTPESLSPLLQAGGGVSETARTLPSLQPGIEQQLARLFVQHGAAGHSSKDSMPEDACWSRDQIRAFIESTQCQTAGSVPVVDELLSRDSLDLQGFIAWMKSSQGAALRPQKEEDLSWPLSSYFISSSHNTYLTGNQLSSDSSTKPYTDILLRGGRCIEIDVWDGHEPDGMSSASSTDEGVSKSKKTHIKRRSTFNILKEKLQKVALKDKSDQNKDAKSDKPDTDPAPVPASSATPDNTAGTEPEIPAVVEPRVLHGYTLTKEIPFRAVCDAIRDSAFIASDLPVIVSLEVHCSPSQQLVMVQIMKEAWEGLLATEPTEEPTELPSPDKLRRKIVVKVKYVPADAVKAAIVAEEEDSDDMAPAPAPKSSPAAAPKKPAKTIHELSCMGFYARGVSFKQLSQPEATMPTHVFSLSEKKVLEVHEKQSAELFKHNRDFLMRTYPWGLRISSSNLDPAVFWRKGIQVVALNWQSWDEGMMLNEGMFAGTSGYVLKPPGYRPDRQGGDATANVIVRKALRFAITIVAAQNIPLPSGDKTDKSFEPYVKVELHVEGPDEFHGGRAPNDGHERESAYKVRTHTRHGRDPDFASQRLEFPEIPHVVDELSWVRFTIRDDEIGRDDLAAWACFRLDRLGAGYRFVHLLDCEGRLTDGAILVKIEKTLT